MQHKRQLRWSRGTKIGAFVVAAAVGLGAAVALLLAGLAPAGDRSVSARADFKIAYEHSNGPVWATGDVFLMNADGSEQRNLSRAPGLDGGYAWSPDGRKIAFLSRRDGKQEIYVVNADGSGLRNLTRSPEHEFAPAWSPDGRKIVFTRSRDFYKRADVELYVMNADGSGQRRLTHTRGRGDGNPVWSPDGQAVWSPDGRMLAFATKREGNFEVYVMKADGSGEQNLTRNPARDFFYTWLPDGRIAFFSERDGTFQLYVMNADGSEQRNLTREWGPDLFGLPDWSPSGGKIAFMSDGSLYVMNLDGSERRKLAEAGGGQEAPSWSPDGRKIAFAKNVGGWERGSSEIFVVNTDGSGLLRLTRRPGHDFDPVWSPVRVRHVTSLTSAHYVARARVICKAATTRFRAGEGAYVYGGTLHDDARHQDAAARFSQEVLVKLRQLPLPLKADRARAVKWFALAEQQTAVLHAAAAAAAAGDKQRFYKLVAKRVDLTHQKDAVGYLPPECPLALSA